MSTGVTEGVELVNRAQAIESIRRKFAETGSPTQIPLLKGGSFAAELTDGGLNVDNLSTSPFLPWAVFEVVVKLLARSGGRARRGDAMKAKLGEPRLQLDSVEGHVAQAIYGKGEGDTVFRRITPIACILIWAGVCEHGPHELILRKSASRT